MKKFKALFKIADFIKASQYIYIHASRVRINRIFQLC